MPRAIWDGHVTFGLVSIPVKLYSAEDSQAKLSFRQVDSNSMSRVHQLRVNDAGEEVAWDDIVKGYETEDGTLVVLTPEDFERANVEATRTIEIVQTACIEEVDPAYFVKPYFLAPSGKGGEKPYALLRETLGRQKRAAVARIVMHTREHMALLYPRGEALVLEVLRFAHELRDPSHLDLPGDAEDLGLTAKEIELAERLVEDLAADWNPSQYRDTYHEDVLALIEQKLHAGETYEPEPLPARDGSGEVVDLMAALKASLRHGDAAEAG
jgi:DNA end-binding protein Ku